VAFLVVTLLFLTPLFTDLPEAALGAIVIHAVARLIKFRPITALKSRDTVDYWAAVAALIGVLAFDVLAGLMIGVLVSLGGLMARAVRPRII
jgi:MFS superfamily sulfate permease-like transporter